MQVDFYELSNGTNNTIVHLYRPAPEVTIDELLDSNTWLRVAPHLDKEHIIRCIWQDMSKECELRVLSKRGLVVRLAVKSAVNYSEEATADAIGNYRIAWRGKAKFCVLTHDGTEVLFKGFDTKEDAYEEAKKLAG